MTRPRRAPLVQRLRRNVVGRREPHGVVSLRFLLPKRNAEQRAHRRLLATSMPSLPRAAFVPLNSFLWLRWVLFEAWRQVRRVVAARSAAGVDTHGIAATVQKRTALRLALVDGIGPRDFYDLELFLPERRSAMWTNVFTNEIGAFHHRRSLDYSGVPGRISEQSRLLSDKAATRQRLETLGVSASVELRRLPIGSTSNVLHEFDGPMFCKPNVGNASRGAFRAECVDGVLLVAPVLGVMPQDPVAYVDRLMAQHELLVERCLDPHPVFVTAGAPDDLAVVARIITEAGAVVCAYVEVPWADAGTDGRRINRFSSLTIDIESGRIGAVAIPQSLATRGDVHGRPAQSIEDQLAGLPTPHWTEAVMSVERASAICPDVFGVAWDVAICPDGPVVIEANTGWSVTIPQRILGPLLARESTLR